MVVNTFVDCHDALPNSIRRNIGDVVDFPTDYVDRLCGQNLVKPIGYTNEHDVPWGIPDGRDLSSVHPTFPPIKRIVACLNVWNDRAALEQTLPTWIHCVDAVVAIDGAYPTVPTDTPYSTDGTQAYLRSFPHVTVYETEWMPQIQKRSQYFRHTHAGDLLFSIDADEFVLNAETIFGQRYRRRVFPYDVGWVRIIDRQVYERCYDIPRLIRWRPRLHYEGRHHWVYAGKKLLYTHQYAGMGVHRTEELVIDHHRHLGRTPVRISQKHQAQVVHVQEEANVGPPRDARVGAREALQILQIGLIDPGNVVCRLHTGINSYSPHSSIFARGTNDNPYAVPYQYDYIQDRSLVTAAARTADIVHCHAQYHALDALAVNPKHVVMHHHGTSYRQAAAYRNQQDALRAELVLVSNLELTQYGEHVRYLPNPVPVALYRRYARQHRAPTYLFEHWNTVPKNKRQPFRIAHSPSKRSFKGTEDFLEACRLVNDRVPVIPVLIENVTFAESLRIRARCHASFDSFWLGMQCSGLEAAAMGQPVIAGDAYVMNQYVERYGAVPYTVATNVSDLVNAIERLATDRAYYDTERARVFAHVQTHHDTPSVVIQYLDVLDEVFGWRNVKRLQ